MVPTMIGMLLNHPEFRPERLASLHTLTYGASPMPAALLDQLLSLFPDARRVPGLRHDGVVGGAHRARPRRAPRRRRRGCGRRVGRCRASCVSIQDPIGEILPPGETGEVCARAGNFMREYWKKPEATAEAFRGGWYHSGDAGYLDADGYLFLVDRVKDMIVTGGENVYSVEVENAIASHPAVEQVAVIGIPSEKWGEAVHAIVVVRGRRHGDRGRDHRARPRVDRGLQGAEVGRDPHRAAAPVGRDEGVEAGVAGALLGRARARGELTGSRRLLRLLARQFSGPMCRCIPRGLPRKHRAAHSSSGGPDRQRDGRRRSPRDREPVPPAVTAQEEAVLHRRAARGARREPPGPSRPPAAAPRRTRRRRRTGRGRSVVGARHTGRLLGTCSSPAVHRRVGAAATPWPPGDDRRADRPDPRRSRPDHRPDLVELLAEQLRMQVIDLARVECDRDAVATCCRRPTPGAWPRCRCAGSTVRSTSPSPTRPTTTAVAELMNRLGAPLRLFLATRADIDAAVDRIYG